MTDHRKKDSTRLCSLFALALVVTLCTPQYAGATGKPEPAAPSTTATSSASAGAASNANAASAIDLSLMNAPAGASLRQGNSYSFVGGQAPALPPGLCPKSKSSYRSFVVFTWSDAENGTDMDCLEKVLSMLRDTTTPRTEVRYVSIGAPPAQPVSAPEASRSSAASATDSCVTAAPAAKAKPQRRKAAAQAAYPAPDKCTPSASK